MIKTVLKILVLTLWVSSSVLAASDAGVESLFSNGVGARSQAMGGGFVSLSDDASAVYFNPAGLPLLNYQEISLMHMELFEGTNYNFAGWVYPDIKLGGFGFGYFRIGSDDITRTENFIDQGTFDYSISQFMASYGKKLNNTLSFGFSVKLLSQKLDNYSDNAVGVDFGFMGQVSKYIRYGFIARDISQVELELYKVADKLPVSFAGGLGIKDYPLTDKISLTTSFELELIENRDADLHTGGELSFENKYFLRAGYDRDNFAFGAGMNYDRFRLDYAYKILDDIGDSHRFSLTMHIGSSIEDKLKKQKIREEQRGSDLLEGERQRQFEQFSLKADEFYSRYMLDSALVYYQRALAFDEGNRDIIGTIAAIEEAKSVEQNRQNQLEQIRMEMNTLISTYMTQAENFYAKKYYLASLDMLELIFEINPSNKPAKNLEAEIDKAVTSEINSQLAVAKQAEAENRYNVALAAYSRVMELDPENATVKTSLDSLAKQIDVAQQLNRGIEQYNRNQLDSAQTTFRLVLRIDKNNPVALEYLKKLTPEDTRTTATTLEDLQKDKEIWQLYLDGLRFMRDQEYQKAIDAWNKVLKAYPNNINTINNIEQARLRLKSEE